MDNGDPYPECKIGKCGSDEHWGVLAADNAHRSGSLPGFPFQPCHTWPTLPVAVILLG